MDYRNTRTIGKIGRRPPGNFSRLPVLLERTHVAVHGMFVGRRVDPSACYRQNEGSDDADKKVKYCWNAR